MEEKYNAICIRSVSYRDNDKMLTLFTLEKGLVDCIARGVKKQGAKLRFASEPFCFSEYVLVEKNDRRTLIEANQIDGFYDIPLNIDKFYAASAILEFLRRFLVDGEKSYELFLLTVKALKTIEQTKGDPNLALVKFYLSAMELSGYGISFSDCSACKSAIEKRAFFDFDDCNFYCENCADLGCIEMRVSTYKLLRLLDKTSLEDLKNIDLSAYSPTFEVKNGTFYALKFVDFFIKDKAGVDIKTNQTILGDFS